MMKVPNNLTPAGAEILKEKLAKYWEGLSSVAAPVNFRVVPEGTGNHIVWGVRSSLINGVPGPLTQASTSDVVEGA